MPKYTENLNLILPDLNESYDIEVANANNKTIDGEIEKKVNKEPGKGLSTNDFTNEYKKKIDALQKLYKFKGTVETYSELTSKNDNNIGDVWKCIEDNNNYCWDKENWVNLGTDIDLTDYALKSELEQKADKAETNQVLDEIKKAIVPTGGTTGQILVKASDDDNDTKWEENKDNNIMEALSEMQKLIEEEFNYKAGDSITINYVTGGFLTTGKTEITFSISLPKRMNDVTPTIESGNINVRKPDGGYLLNNVSIIEGNTQNFIKSENLLTIRLVYDTAFSDMENNIALAIQVIGLKINFS